MSDSSGETRGFLRGISAWVQPALKSDALPKAALVLSLCALFFGFGAATILFRTFPYSFLRDAAEGFRARLALEDDSLPIGFAEWSEAPSAPSIEHGAGGEAVLVTGGPFRRLDLCPTHGCLAWIVDREGRVLHKWEVDYDAIIDGDEIHVGRLNSRNLTPIGLFLEADGSLIATFHGRNLFPYQVGVAKFDRHGKPLWIRYDLSHHWFDVAPDGVIYAPFARVAQDVRRFGATSLALRCRTGAVYDEGVRAISPSGETLFERSMLELLSKADYPGLFYAVNDGCDPLHVNSVDVAREEDAAALGGVEPGDLLVSIREASAIAVLDPEATRVKQMIVGRTAAQHSARFLPGGGFIAFDNMGGEAQRGGSRVLRISADGSASTTIYPRAEGSSMRSLYQGHVDISGDGARLLVVSSGEGRILEIDASTGRELWRSEAIEPTDGYRDRLGVRPKAPFARYQVAAAYYADDISFLKPAR